MGREVIRLATYVCPNTPFPTLFQQSLMESPQISQRGVNLETSLEYIIALFTLEVFFPLQSFYFLYPISYGVFISYIVSNTFIRRPHSWYVHPWPTYCWNWNKICVWSVFILVHHIKFNIIWLLLLYRTYKQTDTFNLYFLLKWSSLLVYISIASYPHQK